MNTEETQKIQQAIEQVIDDETASIPPLPTDRVAETVLQKATPRAWFFTFMCMNIPIAGWIYLFYLAFNKKQTDRREFAKAYLFYKLIFLIVSAIVLGILIYIGMGLLDQLLAYMEML
ncbi:MAG: hypothetical protein PHV18_13930 [Lachnospiraceae bacterium]|nr:hypothetical protein [Lachnospiraceae bacterium]